MLYYACKTIIKGHKQLVLMTLLTFTYNQLIDSHSKMVPCLLSLNWSKKKKKHGLTK